MASNSIDKKYRSYTAFVRIITYDFDVDIEKTVCLVANHQEVIFQSALSCAGLIDEKLHYMEALRTWKNPGIVLVHDLHEKQALQRLQLALAQYLSLLGVDNAYDFVMGYEYYYSCRDATAVDLEKAYSNYPESYRAALQSRHQTN